MNTIISNIKISGLLIGLLALSVSCERDISDDAVPATFPSFPDVYTDNPVGLTDEFFISFDPAAGANPEAFGTDDNVSYLGSSSIRIDVPGPKDPNGTFVGGIFKDRGEGRDLTGYDALTFWVQGTLTGNIEVGFGTDFETDTYPVSTRINLTTGWTKVIVPIPDPSKLTQEKGMFFFAAGSYDPLGNDNPADGSSFDDNIGYTFWIDEIRFEKLGTLLLTQASVFNGQDLAQSGFVGSQIPVFGGASTFNLDNGQNINLITSTAYFDYANTSPNVASVDVSQQPVIEIIGASGTTTVTASIQNVEAQGSYEITSQGEFTFAPTPTRDPSNVISLFSDAYTNVPVRHYNGFFQFATTQGGAGNDPNNVDLKFPKDDGTFDNVINYTELNFVSIGTYETVPFVDASSMTHLHININIRDESIDPGDFMRIVMESNTGVGGATTGEVTFSSSELDAGQWLSLEIPLSDFSGSLDFAKVGQVFFVSDASISNIYVDNVYFYSE